MDQLNIILDEHRTRGLEYSPSDISVLRRVVGGESFLIHGAGGCGKSQLIKLIVQILTLEKISVGVTATTGVAAINIKGRTLHSWAGIGLGRGSKEKLCSKVYHSIKHRVRWQTTKILIISEISMLGATLFTKLDYIARKIRRSVRPFGGMQLILEGDFLQLPPVKDKWIYQSEIWNNFKNILVPYEMKNCRRFNDIGFFESLMRAREQKMISSDIASFESRVVAYYKKLEHLKQNKLNKNTDAYIYEVQPTILYSKKVNVENYNLMKLNELNCPEYVYHANDIFNTINPAMIGRKETYQLYMDDAIPRMVRFKKGAQVMLKVNIDTQAGYVNGTRAVITDLNDMWVRVKFKDQREMVFHKEVHWHYEDEECEIDRAQIPFVLAYATTIHKSQGATLDSVVVDLGKNIFCHNQAYVALSRVRNLEGLYLTNFMAEKITADKDSLNYIEQLRLLESQDNQKLQ